MKSRKDSVLPTYVVHGVSSSDCVKSILSQSGIGRNPIRIGSNKMIIIYENNLIYSEV